MPAVKLPGRGNAAPRWAALSAVAALLVVAGCSQTNDIDVCERSLPARTTVNRLYQGHQAIEHPSALAALPIGEAALVFTSEAAEGPAAPYDVRFARLGPDGTPQTDCSSGSSYERTLGRTEGHPRASGRSGVIAPPFPGRTEGLVTWTETDPDGASRVAALFVSQAGCFNRSEKPFVIGESEAPYRSLGRPLPVAVRPSTSDDEFVVLWLATNPATQNARLMARAVKDTGFGPTFLAIPPSLDDKPIQVPMAERQIRVATAVAMGAASGRLAIVWYEREPLSGRLRLGVYDRQLRPIPAAGEPLLVATDQDATPLAVGRPLVGAFDGRHLMISWVARDAESRERVMAMVADEDGKPLRPAFQASTRPASEEGLPALTGLAGGGFFLAWHGNDGAGLRGALFATDGTRRFANPACDLAEFTFPGGVTGDRSQASVAELRNGDLLVSFTDWTTAEIDPTGASIRSLLLPRRATFPLE